MQSNESNAIGNLRAIVGAQVNYHGANGRYAASFNELSSGKRPFLDGDWSIQRSGYQFRLDGGDDDFTVHAYPVEPGETGTRYFFTDASGVIRYNADEPASKDDSGIGVAVVR